MRSFVLAAGLACGLVACSFDYEEDISDDEGHRYETCTGDAVCDLVDAKYQMAARPTRSSYRVHVVGALAYDIVFFEFGEGGDCPAGCIYPSLCSIVVDGQEYPAFADFYFDPHPPFDVHTFCSSQRPEQSTGASCDMPAFRLPLIADPALRTWASSPPEDNRPHPMFWCKYQFAEAFKAGLLPHPVP